MFVRPILAVQERFAMCYRLGVDHATTFNLSRFGLSEMRCVRVSLILIALFTAAAPRLLSTEGEGGDHISRERHR